MKIIREEPDPPLPKTIQLSDEALGNALPPFDLIITFINDAKVFKHCLIKSINPLTVFSADIGWQM